MEPVTTAQRKALYEWGMAPIKDLIRSLTKEEACKLISWRIAVQDRLNLDAENNFNSLCEKDSCRKSVCYSFKKVIK